MSVECACTTRGLLQPFEATPQMPPAAGAACRFFLSNGDLSTSDVADGIDLLLSAGPASAEVEDASEDAAVAPRGPSGHKQHALRLHQLCVECLMPEEELAARKGWKTVNACYLEGALLKEVMKGKRASTLCRCRSVRRPCPIGMCANFGAGSFRRGHRCPRSCTYANSKAETWSVCA